MTTSVLITGLIAGAVLVAVALHLRRNARRAADTEVALLLRGRLLSGALLTSGGAAHSDVREQEDLARCAVMDWGLGEGVVATLVACGDNTVSLYNTKGGSRIGLGETEAIRHAGRHFLDVVEGLHERWDTATEFPLPKPGEQVFYLVTPIVTLTSGPVPTHALREGHPLYSADLSAQAVIATTREVEEGSRRVSA